MSYSFKVTLEDLSPGDVVGPGKDLFSRLVDELLNQSVITPLEFRTIDLGDPLFNLPPGRVNQIMSHIWDEIHLDTVSSLSTDISADATYGYIVTKQPAPDGVVEAITLDDDDDDYDEYEDEDEDFELDSSDGVFTLDEFERLSPREPIEPGMKAYQYIALELLDARIITPAEWYKMNLEVPTFNLAAGRSSQILNHIWVMTKPDSDAVLVNDFYAPDPQSYVVTAAPAPSEVTDVFYDRKAATSHLASTEPSSMPRP